MTFSFIANGVESKYSVGKEISKGAFGVVMEGRDRVTSEIVAIKVKKFDAKTGSHSTDLDSEIVAYTKLEGVLGIPKAMSYGNNFIAMERLGHSLTDIQRIHNYKPFPLRSILLIAEQLIARLEIIHSRGISHRDIKLDNILMGVGPSENVVHIIDFGLSIADESNSCQQIFRRIDLKQAGIVIKSLYQGSIGVVTPNEIIAYSIYCDSLKDGDRIDYKYLRDVFTETFRFNGFTGDVVFDGSCVYFKNSVRNR